MLTAGRLWWLLRRDLRRGWRASWHDYQTRPRIADWSPPAGLPEAEIPVHLLTGAQDWQLAGWMLASFVHTTQRDWPIVLHDDGTLSLEATTFFIAHFPRLKVWPHAQANARMQPLLAGHPHCAAYRARHPLGLKIFDMPALTPGDRFIVLDSDLLFFRPPTEILAWADSGARACWFNQDAADTSLVTAEEARTLGVDLWPAVNSGLGLLVRDAFDLAFCERALAETGIEEGHIWRIEQSLFALCASRFGVGGLLPRSYEVSLGNWAAPHAIARHYVGAVRDRFYGEGLARLAPALLP